jgi:uncharacterized membrane protein
MSPFAIFNFIWRQNTAHGDFFGDNILFIKNYFVLLAIVLSMFTLSFTDTAIVLSMFTLSFTDTAIVLSMFMLSFTDTAIVLSMFTLSFTDTARGKHGQYNSSISECSYGTDYKLKR